MTPLLTTIHGFSSPKIVPVFKKYNRSTYYVSISNSDRNPELDYIATIHHGIDLDQFTFNPTPGKYLLFFGRIHPDKGAYEAIQIAKKSKRKLIIAGIIQEASYFDEKVKPYLDNDIRYVGNVNPEMRDKLIGNAFALLHPINFAEPFGLSVIESLACGTPVIAFEKGSMSEIISNGENGFLVSKIEEAVVAVKNIAKIDRLFCRKDAEERFSLKRMIHDYINVYEMILKKGK